MALCLMLDVYRYYTGYTPTELARVLGKKQDTVIRWLSCDHELTKESATFLSHFLHEAFHGFTVLTCPFHTNPERSYFAIQMGAMLRVLDHRQDDVFYPGKKKNYTLQDLSWACEQTKDLAVKIESEEGGDDSW